jgi:hypothetical protein
VRNDKEIRQTEKGTKTSAFEGKGGHKVIENKNSLEMTFLPSERD